MHLDRTNAYTQQYAAGCKQVAEEFGLPVVDLWSELQQINVRPIYLVDEGLMPCAPSTHLP